MQVMGLLLFLWIVVGSTVGLFLAERFAPRVAARRIDRHGPLGTEPEPTL